MAKTALKNKAAKTPKFKVRGYTRCQRCGAINTPIGAASPFSRQPPAQATPQPRWQK